MKLDHASELLGTFVRICQKTLELMLWSRKTYILDIHTMVGLAQDIAHAEAKFGHESL